MADKDTMVGGYRGAWVIYGYDVGPYSVALFNDLFTAVCFLSSGYELGFWPYGMELKEAIEWWRKYAVDQCLEVVKPDV